MGRDGIKVNAVAVFPPETAANDGICVAWDTNHGVIDATEAW